MLFKTLCCTLLAIPAVFAATPAILLPKKHSLISPNTQFNFDYQSIADYGVSSFALTVWLFTSPPKFFDPSETFATGYYFGRYSVANYPANPSPTNLVPPTLTMPDFSKLGGWAVGSPAQRKVYLAVIEEYGTGQPSAGFRMSLAVTELDYNGTHH